jgi:UDP-N-acetylglucosamine 2-epimerase (non-hydrolysing)
MLSIYRSMKRKIFILIGTRPNFIKVTRFKELSAKYNFEITIIHTGQHFDENMAEVFFKQFNLKPDYFLNVGGMSPVSQIGYILTKFEQLILEIGRPDFIMVPGDVNSTLAGALVANKMGIKLIHLESGLRSRDLEMPEEHNRIITDSLADYCFVTENSGIENLVKEESKAEFLLVGNTMIDTLVKLDPIIQKCKILEDLEVAPNDYFLATFHRPSNVDDSGKLTKLVSLIEWLSSFKTVVLPLHPRSRKRLKELGKISALENSSKIKLIEPIGYIEFQKLIKESILVITDSGGIQEETTYRQIPCLTLRENTERPITITKGTNTLVKFEKESIEPLIQSILMGTYKKGEIPEYWDGQTTDRILNYL